MEEAIPLHAKVSINYPKGELQGDCRYCVYREIGYFIGIQFEPGVKWSRKNFKPQHLLDPRRLLMRENSRTADVAGSRS